MKCPDDGRDLDAGGACPTCRGRLLEAHAARARWPEVKLAPETRLDAPAFKRTRLCPACEAPMAPLRIGDQQAWVERCPGCDHLWVDSLDPPVFERLQRRGRLEGAVASLPAEARRELATGLAAATAGGPRALDPVHKALAWVGLPVVENVDGDKRPWATYGLAAALLGVFLLAPLPSLVFVAGRGGPWHAFTAIFAHFGWLHLLGNVYFLVAFGDGVEQRLPRALFVGLFVVAGIVSTFAQGAVAAPGTAIGGASGAVEAVMGACIVLQPRARVVLGFGVTLGRLPIVAFGVLELCFQLVMRAAGVPGVGWTAHLVGLALGVAAGLAWRAVVVKSPAVG